MTDHASALVAAFVLPGQRERLLGLLATTRGRAKARRYLAHFQALDPRYARQVPPGQQDPPTIRRLLEARGAPPTCHVFSEDPELDGQELALADALERIIGQGMGTLLSCVPRRLGYYEGEEPRERYILERAA